MSESQIFMYYNGVMLIRKSSVYFSTSKWKLIALIILVFLALIIYQLKSILSFRCSWDLKRVQNGNFTDEVTMIKLRLEQVTSEFKTLKSRHDDLMDQVRGFPRFFNETKQLIFEQYEKLRRRMYSNTQELGLCVNYKLSIALNKTLHLEEQRAILKEAMERKMSLLSDQQKLPVIDGYKEWRHKEAGIVNDIVQRRLRHLQNPMDCRSAKKLVCYLNKNYCGFGCQIHHVVYCLIFAYATERTLILKSEEWRYYKNGWDHIFHPLSETCISAYNDEVAKWPASKESKVISIPFLEELKQKPEFLPLAIPKDLGHRIVKFNGDPPSWWIGQMLQFIMKPQAMLQSIINKTIDNTNFESPIVGVHVRRTDKIGVEATQHDVSEYMRHVGEYYAQLELTRTLPHRSIYLATDDPRVFEEARQRYPQYAFYGDPAIAETAAKHRYTPQSLTALIVDLHMLAKCDFLVCTFTSQFGRVAYEMMQANRVDASQSYHSLDDIYHFVGQNQRNRIFVVPSHIQNNDTYKSSLIPWYKTMDQLLLYPFPEYRQVLLKD